MKTFKGEPNHLVRFYPPIGNIAYVRFDENGEYTTDNERIIQRFMHKFDSVPAGFSCKKCGFKTTNKSELMLHYRQNHPKNE